MTLRILLRIWIGQSVTQVIQNIHVAHIKGRFGLVLNSPLSYNTTHGLRPTFSFSSAQAVSHTIVSTNLRRNSLFSTSSTGSVSFAVSGISSRPQNGIPSAMQSSRRLRGLCSRGCPCLSRSSQRRMWAASASGRRHKGYAKRRKNFFHLKIHSDAKIIIFCC